MPRADKKGSDVRTTTETRVRGGAEWVVSVLYAQLGVLLIAIVAAVIALLAFLDDYGEGVRAVIFFLLPTAWGAFALATLDGQPDALQKISDNVVVALAIVAGLVASSVFLFDAPLAVANLALGAMEAFFFVMWISKQPSDHGRVIDEDNRKWGLALLLMVTVISITVAATV